MNMSTMKEIIPGAGQHVEAPNSVTVSVPLFGRLRFVKDTNGMLQIGVVFLYWIYGTFASMFIIVLPHYRDGNLSAGFMGVFLFISVMCLASLIRAATLNPGRVPLHDSVPVHMQGNWTFCARCNHKRPPRAHHCRRCGQCVLRMDHHCPWINNCVGEDNHYAFLLLCFYACLLGAVSFSLCMLHFWVYPKCQHCDKEVFYIKHSIWFLYLLVLLGVNMALLMGAQLVMQHINIAIDRTTIENMQQAPNPSAFKCGAQLREYESLFGGWRYTLCLWLFPCRRRSLNIHVAHPV